MTDEWSVAVRCREDRLYYRTTWVFRRGEYFQTLQPRFFEINTIRKSAARIDCNLHWLASFLTSTKAFIAAIRD